MVPVGQLELRPVGCTDCIKKELKESIGMPNFSFFNWLKRREELYESRVFWVHCIVLWLIGIIEIKSDICVYTWKSHICIPVLTLALILTSRAVCYNFHLSWYLREQYVAQVYKQGPLSEELG